MVSLMNNQNKNIILLVEGQDDEVKIFKQIIKHFPEINLSEDNIIVYNTDIWALNDTLRNEFGEHWFCSDDIDFRQYLISIYSELKSKKITDIFLVFDYERQDPRFDSKMIENMQIYFNNSIENGQLYINYPMIEASRHFNTKDFPDNDFKTRKCIVSELKNYKKSVGKETKHQDVRKFDRIYLQQALIHNIKKLWFILGNDYDLSNEEIINICNEINLIDILNKQNEASLSEDGFVYVLCTCFLFISNYNKHLIFNDMPC